MFRVLKFYWLIDSDTVDLGLIWGLWFLWLNCYIDPNAQVWGDVIDFIFH